MRTETLLYGLAVFCFFLIVHVAVWRFEIPRNDALALIIILLVVPILIFTIFIAGAIKTTLSSIQIFEVFLFHLSLSLIYISSYPAVQAISPSLEILLIVNASKGKRMTDEEIIKRYSDSKLVSSRVEDLLSYSLVSKKGEYFELRPVAKILLKPFLWHRVLLGLPVGKG